MCVHNLPVRMYVRVSLFCTCVCSPQRLEQGLEALDLESQVAVSHHMHAGKQPEFWSSSPGLCFQFFWDKVLLYCPGHLWTHDLSVLASQGLRVKMFATTGGNKEFLHIASTGAPKFHGQTSENSIWILSKRGWKLSMNFSGEYP